MFTTQAHTQTHHNHTVTNALVHVHVPRATVQVLYTACL